MIGAVNTLKIVFWRGKDCIIPHRAAEIEELE